MNIQQYIEHRDITSLNKLHTPFRWVVENKQQRDAINPIEDDKLLLQRDTQRAYVSDGGKFYPITLDSAPHDGRLYGKLNGEWYPVLVPVDDTFRPPDTQFSINVINFLSIKADYSLNSWGDSIDPVSWGWFGESLDIPHDQKIAYCVNKQGSSDTLQIDMIRDSQDNYPLTTYLDTYYFNNSNRDISIVVPVIQTTPSIVMRSDEVLRVLFTCHDYNNVITATVETRKMESFTKECIPKPSQEPIFAA